MHTRDYLSDLTDELEEFGSGSFIEELVSGGPKNYAFMVFCTATGKCTSKCKVKAITLNYNNSEVVNFTSLRSMILEDDTPLHYTILRRSKGNIVVSSSHNRKQRSTRLSLRSAGLWTTLTPSHMDIIRFFYLCRILFIRFLIYRSVYLYRLLFIHMFINFQSVYL